MTRVLVPRLTQPPARPVGGVVHDLSGQTMGTTWSARLVAQAGADLPGLTAMVQRALDAVVAQMSPWEPDSDLRRYNDSPTGSRIVPPAGMATVLARALEIAALTDGAFDPSLGALTDLWGFGPHPFSGQPPSPEAIAAARAAAGWRRLDFDGHTLTQPGGARLDLNGIAKGFGVDQAAAALERAGVRSYLVEVGGELRGTGTKPDGQPWWVELERPPAAARAPRTLVALHGLSAATSGDYRRFFDHDGRRYAHTLDPSRGAPADHGVVSVTVLAPACMDADAWATALTVMGPEAALAFATAHALPALIVSRAGQDLEERLSPALLAMLDA